MNRVNKMRRMHEIYWMRQLRTIFARQLFHSLFFLCLYLAFKVGVNRRDGVFIAADFSASFSTRHPGV